MLFLFANYWVNLKFSEIVKIRREKLDQKKTKTSTKITKVLEVLSFITSVVQWIWFENSNTYRHLSIRTGSKRLFKKMNLNTRSTDQKRCNFLRRKIPVKLIYPFPTTSTRKRKKNKVLSYLPICQEIHQLPAAYLNNDKHDRDHHTTQQNNKNTGQVVNVKALRVASFGLWRRWTLAPIIPPPSTFPLNKVPLPQLQMKGRTIRCQPRI